MKKIRYSRYFLRFLFLLAGAVYLYEAFTAEIIISTDAPGAMGCPPNPPLCVGDSVSGLYCSPKELI